MKPLLRNGTFHLVRRVPARYAAVEPRRQVWVSLGTDSAEEAAAKVSAAWSAMLQSWEAALRGNTGEAEALYQSAMDVAKRYGFRYLTADVVAKLPIEDLLARVEAVPGRAAAPDMTAAKALLGGVPKPEVTVSKALEEYWRIAADKTLGKSEDQARRWRNPRIKAVRNFIDLCGDLPLSGITTDDMQDFRDWWLQRVRSDGVTANSANKDIIHLGTILRAVNMSKRLGLTMPLTGWSIAEGEKGQRPAFSTEWIKDRLLAPGELAGLNTEARCLLLGMINTGYRPSEAEQMTTAQIRLDVDIPHIRIEPVGRTLKSRYARRVVPLLGVSLAAFQECPDGFPRYRSGSGVSNMVNKFLRNNGLLETPQHSLYGLRHSFQDRMINAGVDDRTRRELFGHSLTEERYGDGASLETRRNALLAVAL